jgi:hypothetical protein
MAALFRLVKLKIDPDDGLALAIAIASGIITVSALAMLFLL